MTTVTVEGRCHTVHLVLWSLRTLGYDLTVTRVVDQGDRHRVVVTVDGGPDHHDDITTDHEESML